MTESITAPATYQSMFPYSRIIPMALVSIALLSSCGHKSPQRTEKYAQDLSAADTDSTAASEIIGIWDRAHRLSGIDSLNQVYADTVLFYGTRQDKAKCITAKSQFLHGHPDYSQELSDFTLDRVKSQATSEDKRASGLLNFMFTKNTKTGDQRNHYSAYLTLEKKGDRWKVIQEGDHTTDQNIQMSRYDDNEESSFDADDNKESDWTLGPNAKIRVSGDGRFPKDSSDGDFDGDGKKEYAWLISPPASYNKSKEEDFDRINNCTCYVQFSNPRIPILKINQCTGDFGYQVYHNLKGDGADDIGILQDCCPSCWRAYRVFTLRNNKWIEAVHPISTHCRQWEMEWHDLIRKDIKCPGRAIIRYSAMDTDFHVMEKSVRLY